jgi:hypothetical protein
MPLTRVTSNVIQDGTIIDADISASAAIAPSKMGAGQLPAGTRLSPIAGVKTVWLAPRTDNIDGTGIESDPYNASTAIRFREVLLNRTKVPSGSTVRLKAGEYQSFLGVGNVRADGSGNYGAGLPNISIIGDGINSTKITAVAGNGVGNMFIIAGQFVRFSDMTIDAGWSELKQAGGISGAVIIYGGQLSIVERIRVINHGGDLTTAAEGFPIIIFGSDNMPSLVADGVTNSTSRNAIIRECIVEQPFVWNSGGDERGAYYTALSICGSIFNQINNFRCDGVAIIENNVIIGAIPDNFVHGGTNLDQPSKFRFELGATVGGNIKHIVIRNNTFRNLALGTQNDTWQNEHAFIEGNNFNQVGQMFLTNQGQGFSTVATIPNSGTGNPVVITTSTPHGYADLESSIYNNDRNVVKLSTTGTLPAPLNQHTLYFVRYVSPTQMRLSETSNGAFIQTTSDGIGTHYTNRSSMTCTTIKDNVCYLMQGSNSSSIRHDTSANSQKLIIENNWLMMSNPSFNFVGTLRRVMDIFNTYNVVFRNNTIQANLYGGNSSGAFVSVSENNVDENGLELFWFMNEMPSRTVRAKFSNSKLNGIVLKRAIDQTQNSSPSGNARALTNKATVYVDAGNYELPQAQQIPNYIEIIGLSDANSIRITTLENENNGVFQYVSAGIGSTIKNLTLVAPNGGIAFNSPWNIPEVNQADIRYENIIFTRPAGGTGKMVNSGIIGMRGGTWINCKSEFPMYDTTTNQGVFFGKMYNCNFPAGAAVQAGGSVTSEFFDSVIGGAFVTIGTNGIMKGCTTNLTDRVYGTDAKFERCTFNNGISLSGTNNRIFNSTIETSQTNSINGTATVTISASQSNKPVAGTITVTQLNSL